MSALLTAVVSTDISVEISSDGGGDSYEDIPIIKNIDFGFYAVPQSENFTEYMDKVDNGAFGAHIHTDISSYISSEVYLSDGIPWIVKD